MLRYFMLGLLLYGCSDSQFRDQYERSSLKNVDSNNILAIPKDSAVSQNTDPQGTSASSEAEMATDAQVQADKEKALDGIPAASNPSQVESAAAPVQISGAYLACVNLLETSAVEGLAKTTLACRIQTTGGEIFKAESINTVANFSVIPTTTIQGVTVQLRAIREPGRKYDAIIDFIVADNGDSKTAAATSTIVADLNDVTTKALISHWEGVTSTLIAPIEPAVWLSLLGSHSYMDTVTSQWFAADDQVLYSFRDAVTHCNNLEFDGRSDWRLPSVDELKIASTDRLAFVCGGPDLLSMNTVQPAFYWSSTSISATQAYGYAPKELGSAAIKAKVSNLQNVMCVHD